MAARTLGLVGGLAVGSTIYYYRALSKAFADRGETLHLLITHAEMRRVLAHVEGGEHAQLAGYFAELIASLKNGGAEIAAISAVTPHICLEYLTPVSPLPVADLFGALNAEIRQYGVRRVALFGTRFVIESDLFRRITQADVVRPKAEEDVRALVRAIA